MDPLALSLILAAVGLIAYAVGYWHGRERGVRAAIPTRHDRHKDAAGQTLRPTPLNVPYYEGGSEPKV